MRYSTCLGELKVELLKFDFILISFSPFRYRSINQVLKINFLLADNLQILIHFLYLNLKTEYFFFYFKGILFDLFYFLIAMIIRDSWLKIYEGIESFSDFIDPKMLFSFIFFQSGFNFLYVIFIAFFP